MIYNPVQGGLPKPQRMLLFMAVGVLTIMSSPKHTMRTPNPVQTFLGLDHSLGQCRAEDVRSQPVDRDEGYDTTDPSGHVPNHTEIEGVVLIQIGKTVWWFLVVGLGSIWTPSTGQRCGTCCGDHDRRAVHQLALEATAPLMGFLVGCTYMTFNGFCERKWGGTP